MLLIYCSKDKREQAVEMLDLDGRPYEFASPTSTGVNHYATRVVVVGNHPSIVDRYKGIAKVETVSFDNPEPYSNDEEE